MYMWWRMGFMPQRYVDLRRGRCVFGAGYQLREFFMRGKPRTQWTKMGGGGAFVVSEVHRAVAVEAGEGEVVAIEEIEVVEARLCVEVYLLQVVDYVEFAAVIGFGQQPEV